MRIVAFLALTLLTLTACNQATPTPAPSFIPIAKATPIPLPTPTPTLTPTPTPKHTATPTPTLTPTPIFTPTPTPTSSPTPTPIPTPTLEAPPPPLPTATVQADAQETSTNRAPIVSMVHESLAIQGGIPVLLNAKAYDPDGDQLTYEWTVTPMIGQLAQAFPRNPSWFAPEGTSARVVTITLTVTDDRGGLSSADMEIRVLPLAEEIPTPPNGRMERLAFAVERMLASPSQHDPSMTVEEKSLWLRQAWEFATKSGHYAEMDYEFVIEFQGPIPIVILECYPVRSGEYLVPCAPSRLHFPESHLDDKYIVGELSHILWSAMAHELAHIFTMSSLVSSDDGGEGPRPDLYAISMLALFKQHSAPSDYNCDGRELLADTLQVTVFPATWGGYWFSCKGEHHPPDEDDAHAIVQSLLDGQYPDWFEEEYGLPNGGFALRRVLTDVIALEKIDPFPKQLLVWQLRDAFGVGYCSYQAAADSAYRSAYLPNPWATGDTDEAGCG